MVRENTMASPSCFCLFLLFFCFFFVFFCFFLLFFCFFLLFFAFFDFFCFFLLFFAFFCFFLFGPHNQNSTRRPPHKPKETSKDTALSTGRPPHNEYWWLPMNRLALHWTWLYHALCSPWSGNVNLELTLDCDCKADIGGADVRLSGRTRPCSRNSHGRVHF